ncbi:hypothetical protein CRG98_010899 [Punica granatum]|uniref:Alcohol dehydrogenase-like C-terminal domain-containing protein n=1 Tax=Punica granatum TaxID=22663 RepID=A0A2I0KK03_PUNGR|nr:hypothetical protein CRG98_010899 [Punica granatum]
MVVDEHFVVAIPNNLPLAGAAPLLCAGTTVYSPLKYYGLDKPGLHLGVVGLGGSGHIAVKFAKAMGLKSAMGMMYGIIDTVVDHPLVPLTGLLKNHGKLVTVGIPDKPLEFPAFPLLSGRKLIGGKFNGWA